MAQQVVPEILPHDLRPYAEGIPVPEGPAWGPDGALYVLSAAEGTVLRVGEDGSSTVIATTGGRPNGLAFDSHGTLFIADAGRRAVLRVSDSGDVEVFAHTYGGREFGGPNDLAFLPGGDLIFTDPSSAPLPDPAMSPVYRARPDGTLSIFLSELAYPNGVDLSADGRSVLIAESRAHRLVSFSLDADDNPLEERIVRRFREPASPDGMAVDEEGKVFQTLPGLQALALVSEDGELAELYSSPKWRPTNVTFGGRDMKTVFVTSQGDATVYSFRHHTPGAVIPPPPR